MTHIIHHENDGRISHCLACCPESWKQVNPPIPIENQPEACPTIGNQLPTEHISDGEYEFMKHLGVIMGP